MAQYGQDPVPQPGAEQTTTPITIEGILDKIADSIITSPHTNISPLLVQRNQKTIRNGLVDIGRGNLDKLVLFQKDIKANAEDLQTNSGGETLTSIVNTISEFGGTLETTNVIITPFNDGLSFSIHLVFGDLDFNVTNILSEASSNEDGTETVVNPLNVSQFVSIVEQRTEINTAQADEFLDTTIYELLPSTTLRQQQIDDLFVSIDNLLPPNAPTDEEYGITDEDGRVNRVDGEWVGSEEYYYQNSITAPQDNPTYDGNMINEQQAYITRLIKNENEVNSSKSIESLRNRLNNYLKDIDEPPVPPQDNRPEYENQSEGYLKFRNLNQGIIVRNTEGDFIESLNPNTQDYLTTGFTISMWVRFLDKTSQGTLFNFGNPMRENNPLGFRLETYVLNKNDDCPHPNHDTWEDAANSIPNYEPSTRYFTNSNDARFVRLVVYDNGILRDSHVGVPGAEKLPEGDIAENNNEGEDEFRLLQTTFIPEDFKEWYFINATFNPKTTLNPNGIDESNSFNLINPGDGTPFNENPKFWMNNLDRFSGIDVVNSGHGNRCKVEIISKTDLLRARGFKV